MCSQEEWVQREKLDTWIRLRVICQVRPKGVGSATAEGIQTGWPQFSEWPTDQVCLSWLLFLPPFPSASTSILSLSPSDPTA